MAAMNITTIDIGTNTVLALDTTCLKDRLAPQGGEMEITRLGQGLDASGRISPEAMERTLKCLSRHGRLIRALSPDRAAAVATEAVRKAENGDEFLARAKEALGFPVEVIDGQREAYLSWLATSRSLPRTAASAKKRTVVDIGGGSTELVLGDENAIERAVSIAIGSVRLTERLLRHDPPNDEERRALVQAIDRALDGSPPPEGELVGIAGTVTTLCAMKLSLTAYDAEAVHGKKLSRADVDALVARLGTLSAAERKQLPGLDPRRADVIYAGGMILARVLARGKLDGLTVSDRGVRWGLAYEIAEKETGRRLS